MHKAATNDEETFTKSRSYYRRLHIKTLSKPPLYAKYFEYFRIMPNRRGRGNNNDSFGQILFVWLISFSRSRGIKQRWICWCYYFANHPVNPNISSLQQWSMIWNVCCYVLCHWQNTRTPVPLLRLPQQKQTNCALRPCVVLPPSRSIVQTIGIIWPTATLFPSPKGWHLFRTKPQRLATKSTTIERWSATMRRWSYGPCAFLR